MAIISYLAQPFEGKLQDLLIECSELEAVEVIPAQNKEVVVIITETESDEEDEELKKKLESLKNMKLLTMVSGFQTPQNK